MLAFHFATRMLLVFQVDLPQSGGRSAHCPDLRCLEACGSGERRVTLFSGRGPEVRGYCGHHLALRRDLRRLGACAQGRRVTLFLGFMTLWTSSGTPPWPAALGSMHAGDRSHFLPGTEPRSPWTSWASSGTPPRPAAPGSLLPVGLLSIVRVCEEARRSLPAGVGS